MLNKLTIKARLILLISVMTTISILLGAFGFVGMKMTNSSLYSVYIDRTIPTGGLSAIKSRFIADRLAITNSLLFPSEKEQQIEKVLKNLEENDKAWQEYLQTYLTPEEKQLAEKFTHEREVYTNEGLKPAIQLLKENKHDELGVHIKQKIRPLYQSAIETLDLLVNLQLDVAKIEYESSQRLFHIFSSVSIGLVIFGLLGSVYLGSKIIRGIVYSLTTAQKTAEAIASGDLSSDIKANFEDETGMMLRAMKSMQTNLKELVQEIEGIVNAAVKGDFSKKMNLANKRGFGKEISVSLNQLSDTVDTGFADVIRVAGALANGDLSQKVTRDYQGVFGQAKQGVNNTVDSLNKIVSEIEDIVEAAASRGEFSIKINMQGKAGYVKTLAQLLNQLSDLIDNSLQDALRVSNAMSQGDLTQSIIDNYPGLFGSLKTGINGTAENLKALIEEIKQASNAIETAAKEIASGNNDLSHRTEQQAASLEETAASMAELASTVKHNTNSAKEANTMAQSAADTAGKGVSVVNQVVATMADINESSLRIADIISVIDDIAFQTNILALNAAVEAARAGEQGKGFAVVAIEVRNLAQRAAAAADEIKRLISDSVERVTNGGKQVTEAGQTMQDIVEAIKNVTNIMSEIATASIEQGTGISQVNQAIGQMDDVTQQNAALVEEAAAAAESLEEQTRHLSNSVGNFKTGNGYNRTNTPKPAATYSTPVKVNSAMPKPAQTVASVSSLSDDDWEEF